MCLWPKKAVFGCFGPCLAALWHTQMALPDQRNGSNASPGMCPDLFHPCSTLFHQFGATRLAYGPKWSFCSHMGLLWLRTGGRVWNIGGTSQGTSPVMHWNRFWGQGCRCTVGEHWLLKQFSLNHPVEHIQKPKLPELYVRVETSSAYFIIHNQFVK